MLVQKNANWLKAIGVFLALSIALCSLAPPSLAQENQSAPPPPGPLKSERTAMTLSLLGTLIPWGLFLQGFHEDHSPETEFLEMLALGGFIAIPIGPSLGYFYANSPWRGLAGIGIRAIGLAGFLGGFASAWSGSEESLGSVLALTGAGLVIASTVYDLARVKSAVRRHNSKVQGKSLAIVPVLFPRSKTVGLQVQFSF